MSDLFDSPIFWRGIQGTLQTAGLIVCGLLGVYLAFRKEHPKSYINIQSPVIRLIYSGRTIGIVLAIVSVVGLAIGLSSGGATRESEKDGYTKKDLLHYHGETSADKLSARQWYSILSQRPEFAKEPLSQGTLEALAVRLSENHPELSQSEVLSIAFNYRPAEHLTPLLEDVMSNMPKEYRLERLTDIFAGELPNNAVTASLMTPGNGYLILLPTGSSGYLHQWAKPTVAFLAGTTRKSSSEISRILANSIEEYVNDGKPPNFREFDHPSIFTMVSLISASAVEFLIAHEYAHIVLEHDRDGVELSIENEVDADRIAMEIVLSGLPRHKTGGSTRIIPDMQIGMLGIYHAVTYMMLIERQPTTLRNRSTGATEMMVRFGNIRESIENVYQIQDFDFFKAYAGILTMVEENVVLDNQ